MYKKLICLIILSIALTLSNGYTQEIAWDRAAYWDADYAGAWGGDGQGMRDALEAAGYTILNAAELKTWMDEHISDRELSVVVFCLDVIPDTVGETMSVDCTMRRYLDAGGKIVWYADWPLYYQGNAAGERVTWGGSGASSVLGFNASTGPNDNNEEVVFTDAGIEWGLTQTWQSRRPTTITDDMTALATVSSGSAAAWVKHYLPGDRYRGFVRLYDTSGEANPEDVMRLAEYIITKASFVSPADGSYHPDTWATLTWSPGATAASHDVYFGEDYDDVEAGTGDTFRINQVATDYLVGFAGFPYPEGLVPDTTYYWRIDEVEADGVTKHKGDIWSFTVPPKKAYNPDPADGAGIVDLDAALTWTPGFGAKLHTVYFGDDYDVVNDAVGGMMLGVTSYRPGSLEEEKVYYWRVDEFDIFETHKGDVWTFTTPGAIGNPLPTNGAMEVSPTPTLSWTPATSATSHELYFGMDKDAVRVADAGSPEHKGSQANYETGALAWNTTYFWRVDAVYNSGPVKGPVWSFTTGGFLLVDDFESYTDDDAAGQAIWQSWIDGFGIADNGAQVGYLLPPYAEQSTVHGGGQSMPLLYVNETGVTNSEASLTLSTTRDWTAEGVGELSLWFRGSATNAAEPIYVAVSNSAGTPAIEAYDDPAIAQKGLWTEWVIPLQAIADQGINLTNVDKIAIGLGSTSGMASAGGSGTLYVDDIRLYRTGP